MPSPLQSAIYEGVVRHRRMSPHGHEFSFSLSMAYLDLKELERVFGLSNWWSMNRAAPVRFRRADYLGPASLPLDAAVRDRVAHELGWRPVGPIRVLTQLRHFGYVFNPVTFYYCFDPAGARVEAIVAEITNTPWKERHAYVLDRREAHARAAQGPDETPGTLRWRFRKTFHVSPLMPMEIDYDWAFSAPGETLAIQMNLSPAASGEMASSSVSPAAATGPLPHADTGEHAPRCFDATLTLRRRELSPGSMRSQVLRFPLQTVRTIAQIHWQFLLTWLKGVPIYNHPRGRARRSSPMDNAALASPARSTVPHTRGTT